LEGNAELLNENHIKGSAQSVSHFISDRNPTSGKANDDSLHIAETSTMQKSGECPAGIHTIEEVHTLSLHL
jgi:hypothetical protein